MQRRFVKVGVAAAVLVIVSLSSYEAAVAGTSPAAVSKSAGLGACATAAGYLRLVDSSAHCPTGYTSVKVAQSATTAKGGSISCANAEGSDSETVVTPVGDVVSSDCDADLGFGDCAVTIDPSGSGSVQIGGSAVASYDSETSVGVKDRHDGSTTTFPNGATVPDSSYGSNGAVFFANAEDDGVRARLALHLLVSKSSSSFAVDATLDCSSGGADIQVQVTPSN